MYSAIGQQSKQHIEGRLRRVSEFYSTVVCRFVVADMGVLLDVSQANNLILFWITLSCSDPDPCSPHPPCWHNLLLRNTSREVAIGVVIE
jgi:hypothetical protein